MVFRKSYFYILILILLSVWISVFSIDNNLHIIACDVGQGDAILVQHKNNQVLIDGGPDRKVLDCLGRHMPFWDRQIEMVILTHADLDHFGGLIDVFKNYKVLKFGENGQDISKEEYKVLKNKVGGMGVEQLTLSKGMAIRLGLIYLDIVHPEQRIKDSKTPKLTEGTNNESLAIVLNYAQFEALFTGDAEKEVSDKLSLNPKVKDLEYIKVNHHGSKNGLTQKLLESVVGGLPRTDAKRVIGVISAGFKNRYGHPHTEILQMLNTTNVKILRTSEIGDVIVTTDGINFWYN